MNSVNVEFIKEFYDLFRKNESHRFSDFCDKEIEWITLDGMPNGGSYVGIKAVFEDYFPKMLRNFKEFHANPEIFLDAIDHVVVIGRYQAESNVGKNVNVPFTHIYQIKNKKIIKFRQFTDTKKIDDSLK